MAFLRGMRSISRKDVVSYKAQDHTQSPLKDMALPSRLSPRMSTAETPAFLDRTTPTRRPASREAPPAYTPPPPTYTESENLARSTSQNSASNTSPTISSTINITASNASDDRYSFLGQFDTVFLIDDSGSMAGRGWRETGAALAKIAPICTKWDSDGIDMHFMNAPQQDHFLNVRSAAQVQRIFSEQKPYGGTPTGTRLDQILRPYLTKLETKGCANVKPLNIIVITDGEPADDPEGVIIFAANKLEKLEAPSWQVGIQFFQVGNAPEATQALRDLDDGLVGNGCPRDIVDTEKFRSDDDENLSGTGSTQEEIAQRHADHVLKVVLGSVNRRLDRRRTSVEASRSSR